MSERSCPHCGHTQTREPTDGTNIVDCEDCDRSFAVATRIPRPSAQPDAESLPSAAEFSLAGTAGLALAGTLFVYGLLETPMGDSYLGQLLSARGQVPYVIVFFSLWAASILFVKGRRHRARRNLLGLELLPTSLGTTIDPGNAEAFRAYLAQLGRLEPGHPLVGRLEWAMERVAGRADPRDVSTGLVERARLDSDVLDSSYTMLRVLVWAIPILGFIGTVLGISQAVSGFSESVGSAANLEVMRESIGSVTTGLGVAFDTTLLALVMSILIMFPLSALQKAEEELLAHCDRYCDRNLLNRLGAHAAPTPEATEDDTKLRAAIEALETRIARLEPKRDAS